METTTLQKQHQRIFFNIIDYVSSLHPELGNAILLLCKNSWNNFLKFFEIMPYVASLYPKQGNAILFLCKRSWNDSRIWEPLINLIRWRYDYFSENRSRGETYLHRACRRGKVNFVRKLIGLGADLDIKNSADESVLMIACNNKKTYQNLDMINILLDSGKVDIDYIDKRGKTALCHCVGDNNLELVELLLNKGAKINLGKIAPILLCCIKYSPYLEVFTDIHIKSVSNYQMLCLLADNGADLNIFSDNLKGDNSHVNPLMHAAINNQFHIVKFLCKRGIAINVLNRINRSALWYACYFGNVEIVEFLINSGANINLGYPLLAACSKIDRNARKYIVDLDNFNQRRIKIIQILIDSQVDLHIIDENGNSPLTLSQEIHGEPSISQFLENFI